MCGEVILTGGDREAVLGKVEILARIVSKNLLEIESRRERLKAKPGLSLLLVENLYFRSTIIHLYLVIIRSSLSPKPQ